MSVIKILIAEDNPVHASKMEMLLDELGYHLIGICPTEEEILRLFRATKPDILILDIGLAEGGDGVTIAGKINEIRPTPIIFTTSFEDKESIDRALKTNPYAYMVKPVEKPSLQAAIELALYKFSLLDKDSVSFTDRSMGGIGELVLTDSFFIKAGNQLRKVSFDDILWIEVAHDRYCDIVTPNRRYPVRTSMNAMEETLNPTTFIRIHRSHMVNIAKVQGIDELEMTVEIGDHSLPLGGAYKNNILNRLNRL